MNETTATATTTTALDMREQWVAAAESADDARDDADMAWEDVDTADDELAATRALFHARDMDEAAQVAECAASVAFRAFAAVTR
jgi:hypothetical protein